MSEITIIEIVESRKIELIEVIETFEFITIEVYDGRKGEPGNAGKSIYQSWLDDGHIGTESDMLNWFKADPANLQWGLMLGNLQDQADLMAEFDKKLNATLVGTANGLLPLDANAKIATQYFPDEILGNVKFRGTYNGIIVSSASIAYNGLPLPTSASANSGIYFIVTTPFVRDGIDYSTGDWILSIGNAGYSKVDNSDSVTSVFGRIGNIIANESDYQAFYVRLSQVYNNPIWIGSLSKSKVGLGNVDNTSDANKPISIATATALSAKTGYIIKDLVPGIIIGPNITTEQLCKVYKIPAFTYHDIDILRFRMVASRAGSSAGMTERVRFGGTSNVFSLSLPIVGAWTFSAGSWGGLERNCPIYEGIMTYYAGDAASDVGNLAVGTMLTTPFDHTVDNYLFTTLRCGHNADIGRQTQFLLLT